MTNRTISCIFLAGLWFVELAAGAAKKMRPDLKVTMAAYGDYGPGYIGPAVTYEEGGYETSPGSSNVAPEVEAVLTQGMRKLLQVQ